MMYREANVTFNVWKMFFLFKYFFAKLYMFEILCDLFDVISIFKAVYLL